MKLSLLQKIKLNDIQEVISSTAWGDTCIFLCYDVHRQYKLIAINGDEITKIDLFDDQKTYRSESNFVIFSVHSYFGVLKNADELLLFHSLNTAPKSIKIDKTILPSRVGFRYPTPLSDGNILPFCFEKEVFMGEARHLVFFKIDTENFSATWQNPIAIDSTEIPYHIDHHYPPKLDSILLKNNELYVFTSGGKITSVNKWGMDYYAFLKCDLEGKIIEKYLDSGNLHAISPKKKGVNGVISASHEYLILTPVFQSCEYKGKQRIFSLKTHTISEITLPRGLGKSPKLIQHFSDIFWIYSKENQELALCRTSE